MSKEREILQRFHAGTSQRNIALGLHVSRNTVAKVVAAYKSGKLSWDAVSAVDDDELHRRLYPDEAPSASAQMPDYDHVHKELLKPGVTLKLLWDEYAATCRGAGQLCIQYSQFCKLYRDHADRHRLTMHVRHKPGDKMMVDWAGKPLQLFHPETGAASKAYLFVGTLPFSMYCFAEAFPDMKEESWINANIHMVQFFGGTARLLIPDNLKTGIISNRKHEDPVVNRAYLEFADHYHTAILPARVLAPKDKAAVEGNVGNVTSHIIAKLRNENFFSLVEMNNAVRELLERFNAAPFQKREGSRLSVFREEEAPFLQPLPVLPYEYARWKQATVQLNYHVSIDNQNYSCPYAYVRKRVDVRATRSLVEIFSQGKRIASHPRLHGRMGQYATLPEHMPPNHQLYSEWNGDRFRRWARKMGESVFAVVDKLLLSYRVEEQAYKGCLSLLKLAEKYGNTRLELACREALRQVPLPRYSIVNRILATGQDQKIPHVEKTHTPPSQNAFVRGSSYYGGERHEG